MINEEFKVNSSQPKFLSKSDRAKLKESLPAPVIKASVVPIRSRSPDRKSKAPSPPRPAPQRIPKDFDLQKYRQTFRFEWDKSDDTSNPSDQLITKLLPNPSKGKGINSNDHSRNEDLRSKPLFSMSSRDWKILKENHNIEIKGCDINPARSWEETRLDKRLLKAVKDCGYSRPTPVQMQTIPVSKENVDLIGLSHTGSGKSAAYLLPLLHKCLELPLLTYNTCPDGPYALIISPTRELAIQLTEECDRLKHHTDLRVYCIIGGKSIEEQGIELRKGAEILISTPGRLLELLSMHYLVLNQCKWIIIDEADKILLLELEQTIRDIFNYVPTEHWKPISFNSNFMPHQYITSQIYSATMDDQIEKLWRAYLRVPVTIQINDTSNRIAQKFYFVENDNKRNMLKKVLKELTLPVLIFMNEKAEADKLANFLGNMWKVGCLHGGKGQEVRESTMERFREGKIDVLISTDLMSRGINVKSLRFVVNYDCPKSIIDYEHRIGRTGRMGRKGTAITFITPESHRLLPQIEKYLKKTGQKVPEELEKRINESKAEDEINQ